MSSFSQFLHWKSNDYISKQLAYMGTFISRLRDPCAPDVSPDSKATIVQHFTFLVRQRDRWNLARCRDSWYRSLPWRKSKSAAAISGATNQEMPPSSRAETQQGAAGRGECQNKNGKRFMGENERLSFVVMHGDDWKGLSRLLRPCDSLSH